jgi:hypothetical protein
MHLRAKNKLYWSVPCFLIGLLRGNGFQTLQRVYWSNKATGITADVPSEAELTPQLWSEWQVTSVP